MDVNPAAPATARLVVEHGPQPGQSFSLGNAPQTIGRSANNGIVINDPEISRRHAQITPHGFTYILEDFDSTNGTFVNGLRLSEPATLQHGDSVEFGDTVRLRYWAAGMPPEIVHSPSDDIPTPTLPPEPAPAYSLPDEEMPPGPAAQQAQPDLVDFPDEPAASNRNRILIGCGCLLLLACVFCAGGIFFLDSYEQGRLLYCGGLRPFWETVLGPLGFNPACP